MDPAMLGPEYCTSVLAPCEGDGEQLMINDVRVGADATFLVGGAFALLAMVLLFVRPIRD